MKYLLIALVITLSACAKEEDHSVTLKVWCGACSIDYYNGNEYVHDTLGTMRDTVGPIVDGSDTVGWNVNVQELHQFVHRYDGRRVYLKTRGPVSYYSYLSVEYLNGQHTSTYSGEGDTTALIDLTY